MLRRYFLAVLLIAFCGSFLFAAANDAPNGANSSNASGSSAAVTRPDAKRAAITAYRALPLSFERNEGQAQARAKFVARGRGYTLLLDGRGAELLLGGKQPGAAAAMRLNLLNAHAPAGISGMERLPGTTNYYLGNDPAKWRTGVPTFGRVRYERVYPGIDVVFYGNQEQLEYDFNVAAGADPRQIALALSGAERVELNAQGELVARMKAGETILRKPRAYQVIGGREREVAASYELRGNRVRFIVGHYDRSQPLVIDPVLSYGTYMGGAQDDTVGGIAVYNNPVTGDHAVIVGSSFSMPGEASQQAFAVKFNPTGTFVAWTTWLGGSAADFARAVAVGPGGSVYVAGATSSTNFPVLNATYSAGNTLTNGSDAFVSKLNWATGATEFSTYLGGSKMDEAKGVAVDSAGNIYVTGTTLSSDFPVTTGSAQGTFGGGNFPDAFLVKIYAGNPPTTFYTIVYATYFGGSQVDYAEAIAVDGSGNAYIAGTAQSTGLATSGAAQTTYGGGPQDAFVAKYDTAGSLVYATYLGGTSVDDAHGIGIDSAGNAYVTGETMSSGFPTTTGAFRTTYQGGTSDAFVTKINSTGTGWVYSTFLGGDNTDAGYAIAVDTNGSAYVAGGAGSANFPTVDSLQTGLKGAMDAFVAQLSADGSSLVFCTLLGGNNGETGRGIGLGSSALFVAGNTVSTDFPVTTGVAQTTNGGGADAFVVKLTPSAGPTISSISPNNATAGGASFTLTVTGTNFGSNSVIEWNGSSFTTTCGSATQCTCTVPSTKLTSAGTAQITVTNTGSGGSTSNAVTFTVSGGSSSNLPAVGSISPSSATAGDSALLVTVTGSNFASNAEVRVNGSAGTRPTSWINGTSMTVLLGSSDLASAGPLSITVYNPGTGGGESNSATLSVAASTAPQVFALTPSSAAPGSDFIVVAITGANFTSSSVVNWNSVPLTTNFFSSTVVSAYVPASLLVTAGTAQVTVKNGTVASNAAVFAISATAPVIISLTPPGVPATNASFTLIINGVNFVTGAEVLWNGAARSATFVSAMQLTVPVSASDVLTAGIAYVAVRLPSGVTSSPAPFIVGTVNVAPVITALTPNSAAKGSGALTVQVSGMNFLPGATVYWNGNPRTPTFANHSQVSFPVTAGDLANDSVAVVTATNGGLTLSNGMPFTIGSGSTNPVLFSVVPGVDTSQNSYLQLTGLNFASDCSVLLGSDRFSGSSLQVSSATALRVLASSTYIQGSFNVSVDCGTRGLSNLRPYAGPTNSLYLSSAFPTAGVAGAPGLQMSLYGGGFAPDSVVLWNGIPRPTSYVASYELAVYLPASELTTATNVLITVFNAATNQTSGPLLFPIVVPQAPVLRSLSPSAAVVGSTGFPTYASGESFYYTSLVKFGTADKYPTQSSSYSLTIPLLDSDFATTGTVPMKVTTGALQSITLPFVVVPATTAPLLANAHPPMIYPQGTGVDGWLMLLGQYFAPSSQVYWNTTPLVTQFMNSTSLNATIPASFLTTPGPAVIKVVNGTGGPESNGVLATIGPATGEYTGVSIMSISPVAQVAGSGPFTLRLWGTNFVSGMKIRWNGSARPSTFVSGNQLIAQITAADIATAGLFPVDVANANDTAATPAFKFLVRPAPVADHTPILASISPSSIAAGQAGTLTLSGSNLLPSSMVFINGQMMPGVTYVAANQLTVAVNASDLTQAGQYDAMIENDFGNYSNALWLTVTGTGTTAPDLTITKTHSGNFTQGQTGAAYSITVANSGSAPTSGTVTVTDTPAPPPSFVITAMSGSGWTCSVGPPSVCTRSDALAAGNSYPPITVTVNVASAAPSSFSNTAAVGGGGETVTTNNSAADATTVLAGTTPAITSISPTVIVAGGPTFTLIINGTGFTANSMVIWWTTPKAPASWTSTQLTVTIAPADYANPGVGQVSVANGLLVSTPVTVTALATGTPIITSLSPSTVLAGGPGFILTISGTSFTSSSIVNWGTAQKTPTSWTATQLVVNIDPADYVNPGVRQVTVSNGALVSPPATFTVTAPVSIISTLAGTGTAGYTGDGGGATLAQVDHPFGLAAFGGNVYVSQYDNNNAVRKIDTVTGIISTLASGNPVGSPTGLAADLFGNIYEASYLTNSIYKISPSGTVSGFAAGSLNWPFGAGFDAAGNAYIADKQNHRIQKVAPDGTVTTVAGSGTSGYSGDSGQATQAQLSHPMAVAVDLAGNLYIADAGNGCIRKVSTNGVITTAVSGLNSPEGVAVDGAGNVFVPDWGNSVIKKLDTSGNLTTIAGNGSRSFGGDGDPAMSASMAYPTSVALDSLGNLYFTDYGNMRVRAVTNASPCRYSLSSNSASAPESGATGAITVSATSVCGWAAVSNASWLTITPGTGTVGYSVAANTAGTPRTGVIGFAGTAGLAFTVTQAAAGAPFITALTPASVYTGSGDFTLTVDGGNFKSNNNAEVVWYRPNNTSGYILNTTYVSASRLTVFVPGSYITSSGTYQIKVVNDRVPPSGGTYSASADFPVAPMTPAITTLTPSLAYVGGSEFTLTVDGTNFKNNAKIVWLAPGAGNGAALITTWASATRLTGSVPASYLASAGSAQIMVANDYVAPADGTFSTAASFNIAIIPDVAISKTHSGSFAQGQTGATYTITVSNPGSDATKGTVTVTDSLPGGLTATAMSGTGWNCTLANFTCTRSDALAAGSSYSAITVTVNVASDASSIVTNTATVSGGGEVNTANNNASDMTAITAVLAPTISALSPSTAVAGGTGFTFTITGTGFASNSLVNWGSTSKTPLSDGTSTQITVSITAADIASAGTVQVTVANGTLVSSPTAFTITSPAAPPVISGLMPTAAVAGSTGFTLTISGAGFVNSLVNFGATQKTPLNVTAGAVPVALLASDLTTARSVSLSVANGALTSNTVPFVVVPANTAPILTMAHPPIIFNSTQNVLLMIRGLYFSPTSAVYWNGSARETVFNDSTFLGVTILAADVATTQAAEVKIVDSVSGLQSNTVGVLVNGPTTPAIMWVNPPAQVAGGGPFNITPAGSNFATGMQVRFNGNPRPTTLTSGAGLQARLTAADIATAGMFPIDVADAQGNVVSNVVKFMVRAAPVASHTPILTSLSPASLPTGQAAALTVNGSNFAPWSMVMVKGQPSISTTYVSANQLTVHFTADELSIAGQTDVMVENDGGNYSNALQLTVGTVTTAPDLTITKTHSGNFTQSQTGAAYTVTVTNSGNAETSGTVTVIDTLPAGLTATAMSGTDWSCTLATLTCTRTNALAASASYPAITVTVNVAANAVSSVTNSVTVAGGGETNTANDTASDAATINVAAVPDLTVANTHSGNFTQGQTGAAYTITVTNSGNGPTSGTVTVTGTLPAGLTATAISGTDWSCTLGTLTCTRTDALAASTNYPVITVTVDVAANAAASLTHTAAVSGGGETNTANNSASDATTIIAAVPDLTITKTHSGNFTQGQTGAAYTITVTNSGNGATTGSVTVADTLPTGLTATAISGTGWTCTVGNTTCTRSDALAASASYPAITVTVNVAGTAAASLTNSATVSGGGETNTANSTANDATTVNAAPAAMVKISGDTQSLPVGGVTAAFVVQVNSATGAGIPGVTVNFAVTTGIATLSTTSWVTGSNGQAQITATVGTTASPVTVTASVTSVTPSLSAVFTVTVNAAAASTLTIVSGNGQSGTASTALSLPIVAKVADQYGNGVSGVTVTFAPGTGGDSFNPTSPVTGTNGRAQSVWTLGSATGAYIASVSAPQITPAIVNATAAAAVVAQGYVLGQAAQGAAGSFVGVPITLTLDSGLRVDSLAFGLRVTPDGGAPALVDSLTFTKDASLPAPNFTDNSELNTLSISWFGLTSSIAGPTKLLGQVMVPVPSTATENQTYTVHITGASGSINNNTVYTLLGGSDVKLTVVNRQYLVGDAFPAASTAGDLNGDGDTYDAGEFGDEKLNILDLILALRAVTGVSKPPEGTNYFDAMDSHPVDTTSTRGGNARLDILDLIITLRRVTGVDSARYHRTPPVTGAASIAPPGFGFQTDAARIRRPSAAGRFEFGAAQVSPDGLTRVPVYFVAGRDLDLAGMAFSLALADDAKLKMRFSSEAGREPQLSDGGVAGTVAAAWLDGFRAAAGERLLLGYVDFLDSVGERDAASLLLLNQLSTTSEDEANDLPAAPRPLPPGTISLPY